MSSFNRPEFKYTNPQVMVEQLAKSLSQASTANDNSKEDEIIANKLVDHLLMIRQYQDRNDALDWLIGNARALSGDISYETNDNEIIAAIKDLGGDGNIVTYALYEQALDIMDETFNQMAMASLTGVYEDFK